MSQKTTIEWTDASWNPVRGCVKVSPGCRRCYAETFAERFRGVPGHPYEQGFDPRLVPEQLDAPLRWRKPRRIFVNSMSDIFQEAVTDDYIAACFGVMACCDRHTFQVLTKRAERLPAWFGWVEKRQADGLLMFPHDSREWLIWQMLHATARRFDVVTPPHHGGAWPLLNVHVGVSVESPKYKSRIDYLRETPAAARFLSLEPLLEDLGPLDLRGIHQVIVGAESGRHARPMAENWVRSIRDQAIAQGVAFFYKQRLEGGRKVSLPMLDGRQWAESPRP